MAEIRYPKITVQLTGEDGNAMFIISRVMQALRSARVPVEERDSFFAEATSGDYDHVLTTCMAWVNVK